MASSGAGWKLFEEITSSCWCSSRLHSCLYFFPTLHYDLHDVIRNIAIYTNDTTLYSKCDQVSGSWQLLELASQLKSDLRDMTDCCRKLLVDFDAWKTQACFI